MAKWNLLSEALQNVEHSVTFTWPELDRLVGGMPPSAANYQAWWVGGASHSHARAWESEGFTYTNLVRGKHVTFVRRGAPAPIQRSTDPAPAAVPLTTTPQLTGTAKLAPTTDSDVILVSCVKQKRSSAAAAKDLYTSTLFRKERAYAESTGKPWFILSAEHGLVAPDEWLSPYDRYLPDTPAAYRAAWGDWVVERLELLVGDLSDRRIEVHAGATYVAPLRQPLEAKGATLVDRLEGLNFFERLGAYSAGGAESVIAGSADDLVRLLTNEPLAVTPADLIAQPKDELRVPGLYSWWVDEVGAAELSDGLERRVEPGMIYAGLAGATKWPSGRPSSNTLRGRLVGMHLGRKHKFSTFRLSLGAILATREELDEIDEDALTTWMHEHLSVIAVPHLDADSLGRVESEVLAALDPPLNLDKVPDGPVRAKLRALRKRFA